MNNWKPTASIENLRARAELLGRVRQFFLSKGVLEVETPLLSSSTVTDPHLQSIPVAMSMEASATSNYYLQTSPEFAMKRLLAAGSGSIYQISKAFRHGESGSRHNPEFTMLEWYRIGFDLEGLMDEVQQLVLEVVQDKKFHRCTYRELFLKFLNIDPHLSSAEELQKLVLQRLEVGSMQGDKDDWLNLLLSHCIEPELNKHFECLFVTEYPASQAALAKIETNSAGISIARRFELYIHGIEIANGYFELTDPKEQKFRFEQDQRTRKNNGMELNPLDENFIQAMQFGLPECSGVAIGIDRLVMMALGAKDIADVISFPISRA